MYLSVGYAFDLSIVCCYIEQIFGKSKRHLAKESYKQETHFPQLQNVITRRPEHLKSCSSARFVPLPSPYQFFEKSAPLYRSIAALSLNKDPPLLCPYSEAVSLNNSTKRDSIPFKTLRIRSSNVHRFLERVAQLINNAVAMEIGETP
jgi:hypothetical protein